MSVIKSYSLYNSILFLFMLYIYIYIVILVITLSNYNTINNKYFTHSTMINTLINNDTYIFSAVYNNFIKSIYTNGYTNSSNIELFYCKIIGSNRTSNCNIKYKYKNKSFFMYEFFYIYNDIPKMLTINDQKIIIQCVNNKIKSNSVCITKMINYTASNYLIQMIESYRLFGVTNFFIYYTSSSRDVLKILDYYQKINIITLIKWNYSYETTFMKKYVYGQKWKYNDCYYRNVGYNNLIIFTDLDEIIWPNRNNNILNMLKEYDKMKSDIYIFKTKIYLKEYSSIPYDRFIHIVNDFDIFSIHNACIYPKKFLRKYIINNYSFLKVINIHDIEKSVKNVKLSYIPDSYGVIRHTRRVRTDLYRRCKNWKLYYDREDIMKEINMKVNYIKSNLI